MTRTLSDCSTPLGVSTALGMSTLSVLAVSAVLLLSTCERSAEAIANGSDPLKALAQHVPSSRYGPEYWKAAAARNDSLWRRAVAFCERPDHTEYPSCSSVEMARIFRANVQPARGESARTRRPFSLRPDVVDDTARPPR
jgi:hypothetical protein